MKTKDLLKIKPGDRVRWDPCNPNEFRDNRSGYVLSIKSGIAKITHPYCSSEDLKNYSGKTREMPVNKLKKIMEIKTLILWEFEDDGFYKTITVNAKNESEARYKLKEFLKETNYIKDHPEELESKYNAFKLNKENLNVISSVIL